MLYKPIHISIILASIALSFSARACSLLPPGAPQGPDESALHTAAVQTISVELTKSAGETAVAQLTQLAQITPTEAPPTITPTSEPQPTTTPTAITEPTTTPAPPTLTPVTPTPAPTQIACGWAQLVEDVTAPDGTNFLPGSEFAKIWRLKNIGSCTWTDEYDLVFEGSYQMNGPDSQTLKGDVKPGETVDISVGLISPDTVGRYRGNWKLRTDTGIIFGIGDNAENPIWVEIRVYDSQKYALDIGASFCEAEWRSDSGGLPCPGEEGDKNGFVILVDNPVIEIDRLENEPALWIQPAVTKDGYISGRYPEFEVTDTARFKAVVGCMTESPKCDVIFQLNYQISDGEVMTLWEYREVYDGEFSKVDVDLSALAGKKVKFILTVLANGPPKDDNAFMLVPRIVD